MTTITASSTIGIYLTSPSYTNPVVIDPGVTISSSLDGVSAASGSWTIQNSGSIAADVFGVDLLAGGSVTNQSGASISGYRGIYGKDDAVTVVNAGSIAGDNALLGGAGVDLHAGGSVTNQSSASISGYWGIYGTSDAVTVVNAGSIAGNTGDRFGTGVDLHAGGSVTNQSGARISGLRGIYGIGGAVTVVNYGSIAGNEEGVELRAGGSVTNQSGARISGYTGIYSVGTSVAVVNAGSIAGGSEEGSAGVVLDEGGSVTNQSAASISGYDGIDATGSALTVVNAGSVAGSGNAGVVLHAGGSVTNQSGARISGYYAVAASGSALTVVNAGSIAGNASIPLGKGVYLRAGGSVTNQSGASISGFDGIAASGAAVTVVNAGSISGSSDAVRFAAGFADRLVIDPGATFNGTVTGGNTIGATAVSTLELASGALAGTLTGLGTTIVDFGQIRIDSGATWTLLSGIVSAGYAIYNAGTLASPVTLGAGAVLTNAAGGLIDDASGIAVYSAGTSAGVSVINAGSIAGNADSGKGVALHAGGSVTNQSGAKISGFSGIYGTGSSLTVVNAGSIAGYNALSSGGTGVDLLAGGSVTNQSGGRISGNIAINGTGGAVTVVNAGSISGSRDAVQFAAGFADRLIVDPGATFNGTVTGGNTIGATAVSTLELASGASAGTLTGLGTTIVDFGQVGIDSSATWTLLSGTLSAGYAIYDAGTLTNTDTLASPVTLGAGAVLTNAAGGLIHNASGFAVYSAGTSAGVSVINAGSIAGSASGGEGVDLHAGGNATNQSGASISGYQGIYDTGDALTVVNAGSIAGNATELSGKGVDLLAGGSVTNQSGARISGYTGIYGKGDAVTVVNAGSIAGNVSGPGVALLAGGSVTNQSGGRISGYTGIFGTGSAVIVANAGSIAGNNAGGTGVALLAGGSVGNQSGARISGYWGIVASGDTVAVVNSGSIAGNGLQPDGAGVALHAGGSVTNQSIASISGYTGIFANGSALTVVNAGSIAGNASNPSGTGVDLLAGGSVTNQSTASISGFDGIAVSGGAGTVVNAGSISGSSDAVQFAAGFANRLVIDPGATFIGTVTGSNTLGAGTSSTLELASGVSAGTLNGLGSKYLDFTQIIVNSGATWTLTADTLAAGYAIYDAGTLTNTGTIASAVTLGAGAVLTNQSGGTIGGQSGIYGAGLVTVANSGVIAGSTTSGDGIRLEAPSGGGSVTNRINGTISGTDGIYVTGGDSPLTVLNDGVIAGNTASGIGIKLYGSGSSSSIITNQSSGTISGKIGIYAPDAATTVVNAGSITGASSAVELAYGYANRVIIDPGAVFSGLVNGGNEVGSTATSTLELTSAESQGTISGLGSQFIDFARITIDSGAAWTFAGTNNIAADTTLTDAGSAIISGTAGNIADMTVSGTGAAWDGAVALVVGDQGDGMLSIANQATVQTDGNAAVSPSQGFDIAQSSGGAGDVTVAGANSLLSNTGRFLVGDTGLGSLAIESGATVVTTPGTAGLAGAVIAAQAGSDGSSVNVTGAGSNWQIGGALDVGNAAEGSLNITAGGSVSAGSIDTGVLAGSFGDIVVNGTASQLTATGQFTVGDSANADMAVSGGATIDAGNFDIGLQAGASGVVDVEGSSVINVANAFNVGDAGNAVLSLGADATVNTTSFNIGTAGVLIEFGDPINSGTVTNSNSIVVNGGSNVTTATDEFVNDGLVEVENSGTETINTPLITGTGSMQLSTDGDLVLNANSIQPTQTIVFADATGTLTIGTDALGGFDSTISGFQAGDQIIVQTTAAATFSQNGSIVSVIANGTTLGELAFANTAQAALAASTDGALADQVICFCAGTQIATPSGEVAVEQLAVGNVVLTHRGEARPITWIGVGRVLATRGRRSAATPVVLRKGALADNVPHHDLRVTKGHSFYLDGVLIPVEFLVNHRSIEWDDRAQEVILYHLELASHDVLLANGALAESYRDDGNRWLFRNANSGWALPPQVPCAPVLTGGAVVDAVWRRLLERAGPRPSLPLTEDPDLHLCVDGVRLEATSRHGGAHIFALPARPVSVSIVSRAGVPAELGLARDPRVLGVALRRLAVRQGIRFRVMRAADPSLADGFHPFEPESGLRWTDGDAAIPQALFDGFDGPMELVLHVGGTTSYLEDYPVQRVA